MVQKEIILLIQVAIKDKDLAFQSLIKPQIVVMQQQAQMQIMIMNHKAPKYSLIIQVKISSSQRILKQTQLAQQTQLQALKGLLKR